jgi:PhnB protein
MKIDSLPEGSHTVTPRMFVRGAAAAIEFYQKAFGATELGRAADPSGKIFNADIRIGDSTISLADESPEFGNYSPLSLGGSTMIITLNVEDADALWNQAVSAGAKIVFPIADQFYGLRQGRLEDPFGHLWTISSPIAG